MKKIIIVFTIIILILVVNKNEIESKNNTIRFRILANSNSIEDQQIKKEVVKNISSILNESQKTGTIEETRKSINNNLPLIDNIVSKTLQEENKNRTYNINYGLNYFPKKELNEEIYEEGMYESLVITLGEGSGDNFWCILFPPLCMIDNNEDYEYKSYIKEVIYSILKKNNE